MKASATLEVTSAMSPVASGCLLVGSSGLPLGEALKKSLRAAGVRVTESSTVFDAVIEAERAAGAIGCLIVGVDWFGQQEFRLFPLVRREWPRMLIVAWHSPGFDYKGRLAEIIGADVVLGSTEDVSQFVEDLVESPPAPATPAPPAAPEAPSKVVLPDPQVSCAADVSQSIAALRRPAPQAEPKAKPPYDLAALKAAVVEEPVPVAEAKPETSPLPSPSPVAPAALETNLAPGDELLEGEVVGTIELTEEELRLLLGEGEKES
jgi:hypothetical protein